jgi:hypothetical protein
MKKLIFSFFVVALSLALVQWCFAQMFGNADRRAWDARSIKGGVIHIIHGNIYRKDARTGILSKFSPTGQEIFAQLAQPSTGRATRVTSVTEDATGNLYVSDGLNIHAYSSDGQYRGSLSPGINMSMNGLVALDSDHFFVAGRKPSSRGGGSATIFEIKKDGVVRSFGKVAFPNLSGNEDAMLNTDNMLAFDRSRGLLYQLPQYLYEIRVYNMNGDLVRTITPPAAYNLRLPNVKRIGQGVGVDPSDTLTNLFVLPDGGLAVEGMPLQNVTTNDKHQIVEYSTFVDLYDSNGQFLVRLNRDQLTAARASWYVSVDKATGEFYFADDSNLYWARPKVGVTAKR